MNKFEKNYIGKGTKVANLDIVRVSIALEKLEEIMKNDLVTYDGNKFLVFEVAALKEQDNYKRTHTAYISKKVSEAPQPPIKESRKKKEAKTS